MACAISARVLLMWLFSSILSSRQERVAAIAFCSERDGKFNVIAFNDVRGRAIAGTPVCDVLHNNLFCPSCDLKK